MATTSDVMRLDATIRAALGLPASTDLRDIAYGMTDGWDSVGHMQLVAAIEETFGVTFSPDDMFAMSDYLAVREALDGQLRGPDGGSSHPERAWRSDGDS